MSPVLHIRLALMAFALLSVVGCASMQHDQVSSFGAEADENGSGGTASSDSNATQHNNALYVSLQGEMLTAIYREDFDAVEVHLPDGRVSRLPRAFSRSGARYSDGRETFWAFNNEGAFWFVNERIFHGSLVQ